MSPCWAAFVEQCGSQSVVDCAVRFVIILSTEMSAQEQRHRYFCATGREIRKQKEACTHDWLVIAAWKKSQFLDLLHFAVLRKRKPLSHMSDEAGWRSCGPVVSRPLHLTEWPSWGWGLGILGSSLRWKREEMPEADHQGWACVRHWRLQDAFRLNGTLQLCLNELHLGFQQQTPQASRSPIYWAITCLKNKDG